VFIKDRIVSCVAQYYRGYNASSKISHLPVLAAQGRRASSVVLVAGAAVPAAA
jgi:hypothetical protein